MPLMLEVANVDEVTKRVGSMIGHINYFAGVELPKEFSTWQTQDMGRKRPATKKSRWRNHRKTVSTIVRPHSKYETERSTNYQKRLLRRLRRVGATKRFRQITDFIQLKRSTRPVLREVLIGQLHERISAAFSETLSW